jgi:hypothetical protein
MNPDDHELERELADVSRALRAELRDAQELAEDASEQLARKEADLVDLVLDAMHRGQPLRARVGAWQVSGSVIHVADDLAVVDDGGGAEVDLRLSALSELWVQPPLPGAGRARRAVVPASFEDCLEGLEATGREVELGGADLPPGRCRVLVAARDHLILQGRGTQRVVPRAAVGFVIRRR